MHFLAGAASSNIAVMHRRWHVAAACMQCCFEPVAVMIQLRLNYDSAVSES